MAAAFYDDRRCRRCCAYLLEALRQTWLLESTGAPSVRQFPQRWALGLLFAQPQVFSRLGHNAFHQEFCQQAFEKHLLLQ